MNTQPQQQTSVLDTHKQYNTGFLGTEYKPRIETIISDYAMKQIQQMRKTDPDRVKHLSKLVVKQPGFKLGGRSTIKMNKNKKKHKLRRRYSKKNRK